MSPTREAYTVPTATQVPAPTHTGSSAAAAGAIDDFRIDTDGTLKMIYFCSECGGDTYLGKADPIRCHNCGHRILYKKRTTRWVVPPRPR